MLRRGQGDGMTASHIKVAREFTARQKGKKAPAPLAGDCETKVDAWMAAHYPEGLTSKSAGAYARALYETQPDADRDIAGHHAWYGKLSDAQRAVLAQAKKNSDLDPARQALRKKQRDNDPEYQAALVKKREQYRHEAAAEGRNVRSYRRGGEVDSVTVRAERKARNVELRARIAESLANSRNPYADDAGDPVETRYGEFRDAVNYTLSQRLIDVGVFDLDVDPALEATANAFGISVADARQEFLKAMETLRVAKAITKRGAKICRVTHSEWSRLQTKAKMPAMEELPEFGMF